MATVTGALTDFRLVNMSDVQARITFVPSGVGAYNDRFMSTRPIVVNPASNGTFEVDLVSTDLVKPARWYEATIDWLDAAGGFLKTDFFEYPIFVPNEGGRLSDLIDVPANNELQVIWEPTEPNPWPLGAVWVNSATGDVLRKES